jgi:hypothetical protein
MKFERKITLGGGEGRNALRNDSNDSNQPAHYYYYSSTTLKVKVMSVTHY